MFQSEKIVNCHFDAFSFYICVSFCLSHTAQCVIHYHSNKNGYSPSMRLQGKRCPIQVDKITLQYIILTQSRSFMSYCILVLLLFERKGFDLSLNKRNQIDCNFMVTINYFFQHCHQNEMLLSSPSCPWCQKSFIIYIICSRSDLCSISSEILCTMDKLYFQLVCHCIKTKH